eukprot:358554-Chlamydomonas_euryale.AAC.5
MCAWPAWSKQGWRVRVRQGVSLAVQASSDTRASGQPTQATKQPDHAVTCAQACSPSKQASARMQASSPTKQ